MEKGLNKGALAAKIIAWTVLIFILGGIGGIFMNNYLFPRLSHQAFFEKIPFLKKASENITIINKTEQVTVKEDDSVNQIASRAATAVVNIISIDSTSSLSGRSGSGILVTGDGVIVTYRDVILEKNATYDVILYDNQEYPAKLLAIDEFTNLAYLKIETTNLPAIEFANSNDFKPGKKLVSIGNSLNEYQNRFSAGLLSNINSTFNLSGQTVASSEKMEGVFETDFDNQQSYLGGPVISYGGALVGIIGKVSLDNQDIFFQIPSNAVKESLDKMLNGELDNSASLGVYYITLTKEYALTHKFEKQQGALIYSASGLSSLAIIDGSPAQKAHLKIGDVILAVGDQKIDLNNPLSNLIGSHHKGDLVELTIWRAKEELKVSVQL